eukprot:scaffold1684_cov214-Amphora_coffeaeformis.AAC.11
MDRVTKELDSQLETNSLCIRVGLHSGPATGGVLRGERARFQLFGDTVNTASRIESTGEPRQIHLSQETHDLLKAAGLESWTTPRTDAVQVKGKGDLKTFWLTYRGPSDCSANSKASSDTTALTDSPSSFLT